VEQKIDGLVASLIPPSVTQSAEEPTALSAAGAVVEPRRLAPNGVTSWSDMWQKQGTVAPGSWLPLPSSFEQSGARPDQDVAQAEGEAEVDRQFLDKIRTIHNFGDTEESSQPSGRMFQPSKHREAPIEDDMVQQLFHTHEADALLNEYRRAEPVSCETHALSCDTDCNLVAKPSTPKEIRRHLP
jgi:hypothetical protein